MRVVGLCKINCHWVAIQYPNSATQNGTIQVLQMIKCPKVVHTYCFSMFSYWAVDAFMMTTFTHSFVGVVTKAVVHAWGRELPITANVTWKLQSHWVTWKKGVIMLKNCWIKASWETWIKLAYASNLIYPLVKNNRGESASWCFAKLIYWEAFNSKIHFIYHWNMLGKVHFDEISSTH